MNPVTGLSLGRIAIGAAALARPALVSPRMGQGTEAPLMTQWFGSREVALGLATLVAGHPARRNLVLIGVAVDAADAATAYAGVQAKALDQKIGMGLTAVACFAVVQGLAGLRVRKPGTVTA
ncbi:hypothetical protein [Nocardioides nanhaiensis]|uniref:DUF4267 domain-containing protein n=1 Tax=Nocardioides nanhaiensis TaxID=1476871 RepID=A0ABP8WMC1_9ACTN